MAEGSPKSPAMAVEGIRHSQGNTTQTHQQVSSRQVTDEKVGGVVEFLVRQDASQKEGVPNTSHHHYEAVERQKERFEAQKKLHADEHVQGVTVVESVTFAAFYCFQSCFMAGVSHHTEIPIQEDIHVPGDIDMTESIFDKKSVSTSTAGVISKSTPSHLGFFWGYIHNQNV